MTVQWSRRGALRSVGAIALGGLVPARLLAVPGDAAPSGAAQSPAIDHVMIGVADLPAAIASIAAATGVTPAIGGRHTSGGTWNALASLGPQRYLELIAADPDSPAADRGEFWKLLKAIAKPRMLGLALKPPGGMAATVARAKAAGIEAATEAESRVKPDGETLRWQVMGVDAGADAVSLYLIDWGASTHPGTSSPPGLTLAALDLALPGAEKVRGRLKSLEIELPIGDGPAEFAATFAGPKGNWTA